MTIMSDSTADTKIMFSVQRQRQEGVSVPLDFNIVIKASEEEALKAEFPDAKQVMLPPCVLNNVKVGHNV